MNTLILLSSSSSSSSSSLCSLGISLGLSILLAISMCIIFSKAGKEAWAAIIPIYSNYVLADITTDSPVLMLILMFIPGVNAVVSFILLFKLAKKFGQSTLFAVLTMIFPMICLPILAFGSAEYEDSYF